MSRDLIIVGGGMTGAALALALGRAGLEVALVDAAHPMAPAGNEPIGLRVSTLNPASENLLRHLDVWADLASERCQSFQSMRVWEEDPTSELIFRASDAGLDCLGHVVENARVQAVLWQALADCPEVSLYPDDALDQADIGDRGGRVLLASGERLRARLLVAADGGGSRLRELFGIAVERWDYEQRGVVAVVSGDIPHRQTAWQRFLPSGPLAFLPLSTGQFSIVWSQPGDQAEQCLGFSDNQFNQALTDASQGRFGELSVQGPRAAFPLARQRSESYIKDSLALIGDAAHVIHPLAGQGANLGFLDVASLAEVITGARTQSEDFSAVGVLRRYERWRRADNELMAESMSAIKAFFAMDAQPFPAIRQLGARVLNRSEFIRARLIEHASGFGGKVPKLVRPPAEPFDTVG